MAENRIMSVTEGQFAVSTRCGAGHLFNETLLRENVDLTTTDGHCIGAVMILS